MSETVIHPAAPGAWRIVATDAEFAWNDDAVVIEWSERWEAALRFESPQPLDLRAYVERGTLEFDLEVAELAQGAVRVKLSCAEGCEPAVDIPEQGRALAGRGWQHVALPIRAFARGGADFSRVTLPFGLVGAGSGRIRVANVRLVRDGQPNVTCPDYRTESVTPAIQTEWWALDWWMPRHEAKLLEKRQLVAADTPPQIVFLGDSITQGWEAEGRELWQHGYAPHHALNLGFNGDRTENVLWRLQHGAIDGIAPKVTVLMIGTNNTGHRAEDPQTTAAGIRRIVDEIHHRMPGTQVLLLAIFPRGEQPDDALRGLNERVNQLIAGWSDVHFLDVGAALLGPDGTLSTDVMPDLLHPAETGYALWQRAMAPTLQRLLETHPD